ncbi:MAG: hypothetical protein J6A97_04740 [Clostridia bacterium]|nr:hypothetical protein [Clostridia bacterium]
MKKYLSVFTVIARESIWRLPVLWAVSALLQTAVFYTNMFSERVLENKIISDAFNYYSDRIGLSNVFSFALLLTGILLMKTGMEFRTKTGYTLRRLRISEKQVYVIQALYNCLMIFLLFVFEVSLCFALANWGTTFIRADYITNQTVYLTFYSTSFIYEIFAGRNIVTVIRNILIILSLGFNLSAFSYLWRRGSKYIFGILVLSAAVLIFWISPGFNYTENIPVALTAVGTLLIALGIVRSRREEYDS